MLHLLKSELFIRGGGGVGDEGLGPLFLNFLDVPLNESIWLRLKKIHSVM